MPHPADRHLPFSEAALPNINVSNTHFYSWVEKRLPAAGVPPTIFKTEPSSSLWHQLPRAFSSQLNGDPQTRRSTAITIYTDPPPQKSTVITIYTSHTLHQWHNKSLDHTDKTNDSTAQDWGQQTTSRWIFKLFCNYRYICNMWGENITPVKFY